MLDDVDEKSYAPYLTNKSLSYHKDAIFFTNEMNLLEVETGFKWDKPYKSIKSETIREYYGISNRDFPRLFAVIN